MYATDDAADVRSHERMRPTIMAAAAVAGVVLGRAPEPHADEALRYRDVDDPDRETSPGLVILRVDGELFFTNARWFRDTRGS